MTADALSLPPAQVSTVRVLMVCTANQCRSPMGEVLAARAFAEASIPAVVRSAGVDALAGVPATEDAELTVARLGLDLKEHLSTPITEVDFAAFDTVWCMERRHLVEIGRTWPFALPMTFTLLDLERRAAAAHRHPSEPLAHWLDRIGAGRSRADLLGIGAPDDVADPIGRSLRRYRRTAALIDRAVRTIVESMNGPPHLANR